MRTDLRQMTLMALAGLSVLLYLVSLVAIRRPVTPRDDDGDVGRPAAADVLRAERRSVLAWCERVGGLSLWRFLGVVIPVTALGLVAVVHGLDAQVDEANRKAAHELLRYGRVAGGDDEGDSAGDAGLAYLLFSPFLLLAWTAANGLAYLGVRGSYEWAARKGRRSLQVAGVLATALGVLAMPFMVSMLGVAAFGDDAMFTSYLGLASPGLLLVEIVDVAGACKSCSLAMLPAGLTVPIFTVLVVAPFAAIRRIRVDRVVRAVSRMLSSLDARTLRLAACQLAFVVGLGTLAVLPIEDWLLVLAGLVLEALALPGLARAVLGADRSARFAEWLSARRVTTGKAARRAFDLMASRLGGLLCLPGLYLTLTWLHGHAQDPLPIYPPPVVSMTAQRVVWTPVLGLWFSAMAAYAALLAAQAATRFAPVMLTDSPQRRRPWPRSVLLLAVGLALHGIAATLPGGAARP